MDYTITLTDVEKLALEHDCIDIKDWIANAAQNKARIVKEEILAKNMAHCNANSVALAVGELAQLQQAYSLKVIEKAADSNNASTT